VESLVPRVDVPCKRLYLTTLRLYEGHPCTLRAAWASCPCGVPAATRAKLRRRVAWVSHANRPCRWTNFTGALHGRTES